MTWRSLTSADTSRHGVLAVAALLFAGVFALRVFVGETSGGGVTLLYALPIALLAAHGGLAWGVGAAATAVGLYGVWDVVWSPTYHSAFSYVARGAAYGVVGAAVGELADHLRKTSAESLRFWELSTDLLCTARFDGYFVRLNPAWERTLGWKVEELCAQRFVDFVHPDDRERTEAETASLMEAGYETIVFENRYRCKDGSYRSMLWGARAVPDEGLIYAAARDVTDRNSAQERLRRSEQFLNSVLEHLPTTVFVKDAEELRFVRLNRAGEELVGSPQADLVGKSDHDLFPKQQADWFARKDREVLASGGVVDIPEESLDTVDKGSRILHTRKIAIRDERGRPRYLLGISDDITDRKAAELGAEAARAEAERANRAKSEFLSRMSHELRTPLNAVLGFGQLLELDELKAGQREAVELILNAGRHLLELINEVLDISRIESGTMSISLEPVHLASVLAEALSLIRPLADGAHVRLVTDHPEDGDMHVLADQQRLKQVLINLLSNAVKYNRRGGEVSAHCTQLADGRVEIAVEDTGHGMSAEQMLRLFEPFDRLGAERTEIEGTGLGLSLCKGLVQAMGGVITAESEPGTGSTMRIQLEGAQEPAGEATTANGPPVAATGHPRAARTIVYIEDNLSNVRLVEQLLARLSGVRLIAAMQGKLGIDLVHRHDPDLILLDLHLPDLHGREVLEQLKGDPATALIPVVILSADASPAQLERLSAAGAAGYLTKPIDVQSLLDTVRNCAKAPGIS